MHTIISLSSKEKNSRLEFYFTNKVGMYTSNYKVEYIYYVFEQ